MISKLRKYTETWISRILLALISVSFLFWGLGGKYLGDRSTAVSVSGRKISVPEVETELKRQVAQIQSAMGGAGFDYRSALRMGLLDQIVDNMVYRLVLDLELKDLGIYVSNEKIYEAIQGTKEFQDDKGNFSPELFAYILEQNRIPERAFIAEIGNSMSRDILVDSMAAGLDASALSEMMFAHKNEVRTLDIASFGFAAPKAMAPVADSELKDIYDSNSAKFAEPEYRRLSYIALTPEAAAKFKNLKPSDSDKVYRAIFEMGENIIDEINGGSDIDEVAKSFGVARARLPDVDAGGLKRDGRELKDAYLAPKFRDIAFFALDEGGVSDVLETSGDSALLVIVDNVFPARPKPFESVRSELEKMWRAARGRELALKAASNALGNLGGMPFNKAALGADPAASVHLAARTGRANAAYPAGLLDRAFAADLDRPFVFEYDGAAWLVSVRSLELSGPRAADKEEFAKFASAVRSGSAALLIDDYVAYLYGKFGVRKNADALKLFYD